MCQNEDFIIPKEILSLSDVNWHEKLLLAKIESFNKKCFCENNNETHWDIIIPIKVLINFLEESEKYTLSLIFHLESLNYIKIIFLEESAKYGNILKHPSPNNFLKIFERKGQI